GAVVAARGDLATIIEDAEAKRAVVVSSLHANLEVTESLETGEDLAGVLDASGGDEGWDRPEALPFPSQVAEPCRDLLDAEVLARLEQEHRDTQSGEDGQVRGVPHGLALEGDHRPEPSAE